MYTCTHQMFSIRESRHTHTHTHTQQMKMCIRFVKLRRLSKIVDFVLDLFVLHIPPKFQVFRSKGHFELLFDTPGFPLDKLVKKQIATPDVRAVV